VGFFFLNEGRYLFFCSFERRGGANNPKQNLHICFIHFLSERTAPLGNNGLSKLSLFLMLQLKVFEKASRPGFHDASHCCCCLTYLPLILLYCFSKPDLLSHFFKKKKKLKDYQVK
jgi:hypothetical protein